MKPESSDFLGYLSHAGAAQPARQLRAPAHRVHHQVGAERLAAVGAYACDVRSAVRGCRQRQLLHGLPAADLHSGLGLRGPGKRLLDDRTTGRERRESLIVGAGLEIGQGRGHRRKRVKAPGAGRQQRLVYVREGLPQDGAPPCGQQVGLAKLRHAVARPLLPGLRARLGHGVAIALEHRHLVTVSRQQQTGRQPRRARSQHHDLGHLAQAPFTPPVGSRSAAG